MTTYASDNDALVSYGESLRIDWLFPYRRGLGAPLIFYMLLLFSTSMLCQDREQNRHHTYTLQNADHVTDNWSRLPVSGGHLDIIGSSAFDTNFLYGYIRNGPFFISSDRGYTWNAVSLSAPQMERNYLGCAMDISNRIYILTTNGLWRSNDSGRTLQVVDVPGGNTFLAASSVLVTCNNEVIIWNSSTRHLLRSTDDGGTWNDIWPAIQPRNGVQMVTYHPSCCDVLIIQKANTILVSTDRGISWFERPFLGTVSPPIATVVFGTNMWFYAYSDNHFYVSKDTARSWSQQTEVPINTRYTQSARHVAIIILDTSRIIINAGQELSQSSDGGRRFSNTLEYDCSSVTHSGGVLYAMVPAFGLISRTSPNTPWEDIQESLPILRFETVDMQYGPDDGIYCHIRGMLNTNTYHNQIFQYAPNSISWSKIIPNIFLDGMTTGAQPIHPAYILEKHPAFDSTSLYHIQDGNMYTMLYGFRSRFALASHAVSSPVFPEHLFLHTSGTYWVSRSRSGRWEDIGISGNLAAAQLLPSMQDPAILFASAWSNDPLYDEDAGLYLSNDKGFSWIRINEQAPLASYSYSISQNDILFRSRSTYISTNHGRDWNTFTAGLGADTSNMAIYQSGPNIIAATDSSFYVFEGNRWSRLLFESGTQAYWSDDILSGSSEARPPILLSGRTIYTAIPNLGIYQATVRKTTEITNFPITSARLIVTPNPATTYTSLVVEGTGTQPWIVDIYNIIGIRIRSFATTGDVHSFTWDLKLANGRNVPPGCYFVRFRSGTIFLHETIIVP